MAAQVKLPVQPPPRPASVASKLAELSQEAMRLIRDLTAVRKVERAQPATIAAVEEVSVRTGVMPKSAVAVAQALAFIFRRKRGALLGLSRERAFVVARVDDGQGGTAWSGPVFCKGRTLSLGLTAGWLDMRVCWAIEGEEAVQELLHPHHLAGLNAAFFLDMSSTYLRPLKPTAGSMVEASRQGGMVAKYYVLEAMLVDVSLRAGSFRLDHTLNAAVYGQGVTPDDVLSLRVPPPPQFEAVLELLDEYSRQGHVVMHHGGGGRSASSPQLSALGGGIGSGTASPPLSARSSASPGMRHVRSVQASMHEQAGAG